MKKNLKSTLVVSISILLVVTLVLVGLTYAYYRTRIIGNTSNDLSTDVTVKKIEIAYADGTSSFLSGSISVGYNSTKTFTVTNNGNEKAYFSIVLEEMTNTFMRNHDWIYKISKNANYNSALDNEKQTGYIAVGTHQVIMPKTYVDVGETATYYLEIEYLDLPNENQSSDMGKTLEFKVNIADEAVTWDSPAAPSWEEEGTVSLIEAIQRDNADILVGIKDKEPLNAFGSDATYNGGEILFAEDDYGDSYYYRGNPINNFVTYSNMCWRILRIQGDGTIKIILADKTGPCTEKTYDTLVGTIYGMELDGGSPAVASYSSTIGKAAWFAETSWHDYDRGSGLHYFMSMTQVAALGSEFEKRINKHLLTTTDWCMDGATTDSGSSTWIDYSYNRVLKNNDYSLKCNRVGLNEQNAVRWNKGYRYQDMYVGTITVDEAIMGGVSTGKGNKSYLSFKDSVLDHVYYLTMTPSWENDAEGIRYHVIGDYSGGDPNNTKVYKDGYGGSQFAFIPVVVLKNNVVIKSGDGTNGNAYYVY